MCIVLFVASDRPLPLVAWREDQPAFHVTPVAGPEAAVASQFSQAHVYYIGSHERCACGFAYHEDDYGWPEAKAAAVQSVRSLRGYLEAALDEGASLELYTCADGDWTLPPVHRTVLKLDDIGGAAFELAERTLAAVTPGADPRHLTERGDAPATG